MQLAFCAKALTVALVTNRDCIRHRVKYDCRIAVRLESRLNPDACLSYM